MEAFFPPAAEMRSRQVQQRVEGLCNAVRAAMEAACSTNQSSCEFDPAAYIAANPGANIPTERNDELLTALIGHGYAALFASGKYMIDWAGA